VSREEKANEKSWRAGEKGVDMHGGGGRKSLLEWGEDGCAYLEFWVDEGK